MNKREFNEWVKFARFKFVKKENCVYFWFEKWTKSDRKKAKSIPGVLSNSRTFFDCGARTWGRKFSVSWDFAKTLDLNPKLKRFDISDQ